MSGISLSDVQNLPDPKMEQDAISMLMLCTPGAELNRDLLEKFMIGNNVSKGRIKKALNYAIEQGWMVEEGVVKITDLGKSRIGK